MKSTLSPDLELTEATRARVHARTLKVVMLAQILGGAGLAAGIAVGALIAQDVMGSDAATGLPAATFTLGSALAAFLLGRVTQRFGRRPALALGFGAGSLGAVGVVVATVLTSVPLLFAALFIYGAGTATNLQARYAGTDLALPAARGRAISVALVATTFGAVAGPNLIVPTGHVAVALGLPALAGPFLLAAVAYAAAGGTLWTLLRPDPYRLAEALARVGAEGSVAAGAGSEGAAAGSAAAGERATGASGTTTPAQVERPGRGAWLGGAIMLVTQIVMVGIMTMTPVHMKAHHHGLGEIGIVLGIHVGCMYLPSLVTGRLVDRVGRVAMAYCSGVTLLLAGLVAALAPGDSLGWLIVALALLGLGWNFGLIAGTTMVVDATTMTNRGRTQGSIDVMIALAGAGAGASSGLFAAATSYAWLGAVGGLLAALLCGVVVAMRRSVPAR